MGRKHESMLKKLERVLALTIVIAILLTGCGRLATESPDSADPSEESVESILSSIGVIEDLSFEVNRSAARAIEYDGTETSVEVVDEKGLTWQLTIPENALPDKCTIMLTPLADIKGEHKKDGLSGIMMEPDGLEFAEPATLTVTGSDADRLLFLTGTQNGKNYTYQPAEKLEYGIKLSVKHFSSEVASDAFNDTEAYKVLKETLPKLERRVKSTLSKSIKVPDIMEIPLECFKGIPEIVYQQIIEWFLPESSNALWAGMIMKFCERQGDKIGVNKARRLWLDSIKRFFEKEKAYFDKYHAQSDKFIIVPYSLSEMPDLILIAGGEEPPAEVAAMYYDYVSRREKWAYESVKYSIEKLRDHNYKYLAYVRKCMEYLSYDQEQEMLEELHKALTFKLKIKIVYTQMYGDGESGIIISEGEGEIVPEWSLGKLTLSHSLSGDVKINTTLNGFYKDFKYSPTEYMISAQVKDWDPCKTQSCNIWVSNLGLEEEELGYIHDTYTTFSEVLIWDYALDLFGKELEEGFHAKLHNLVENAVVESFSGKDEMLDITLDVFFDLVHSPQ